MLGSGWFAMLKVLAAILCVFGILSFALIYFIPAPPSTITIASGFTDGNYERIVARYQKVLARHQVTLEMHGGSGGWDNVKLLLDQNTGVQAAFVLGGMGNTEQAPGLLSLGRINYQIFCIFYRATEVLDDLTELKGKRIAAGTVGTGSRAVIDKILEITGVNSENSTLLSLTGQAAVNAIHDGRADAAIMGLESDSPLIQSLLRDSSIRLLSVTRAEALTRFFPYLVRLVLPQGAIDFERKIPASDIVLFSTTNSVLVRDDLHPAHIRLLAQALFEIHDKPGLFQRAGEFPTQTDSEYPMAEGAVDYYKNGPSFLLRYLPFWIVPHVQRLLAVLLAAGVIVYPLFNFAPKLYQWFLQDRMRKLYRRLRIVEKTMKESLTESQLAALQSDLEAIGRVSAILPMRHSETYFGLKRDIDATRTHLASRLVEARSQKADAA